jgi:hypothetical protein
MDLFIIEWQDSRQAAGSGLKTMTDQSLFNA